MWASAGIKHPLDRCGIRNVVSPAISRCPVFSGSRLSPGKRWLEGRLIPALIPFCSDGPIMARVPLRQDGGPEASRPGEEAVTREGSIPTVRANARIDARKGHEVRAGRLTGEPCGLHAGLPLWTARLRADPWGRLKGSTLAGEQPVTPSRYGGPAGELAEHGYEAK